MKCYFCNDRINMEDNDSKKKSFSVDIESVDRVITISLTTCQYCTTQIGPKLTSMMESWKSDY